MIIASIDIGTNTVLLLIADVDSGSKKITPLFNQYKMPRIGSGLSSGQPIKEQNLKALYSVLEAFDFHILKYKCEKIIVTATNAIRIASNKDSIANSLRLQFGFNLDIISGDQEAEFAFLGAMSGTNSTKDSIVIDIGGGSTEIIFGNFNEIFFKKSFQIGSVSATEKFLPDISPSKNQIENLRNEALNIFQEIKGRFTTDRIIAIAGTATTLACMNANLKDFQESTIEGSSLTMNNLKLLIDQMQLLLPEQILQKFGVVMDGREDIILAGAIILECIMETLGVEKLFVSSRGIRYGAIINFITKKSF